MIKIIIHGCNGRMGRAIAELAASDDRVTVAAGVDAAGTPADGFPYFTSIADCDVQADVVVDFSNAAAVDGLLDYCLSKKMPLVLCTTGLSEDQLKRVQAASGEIAILRSANMSVGVNMLLNVLKEVAPKLYAAGFDIEIEEKHHNRKLDAPSGTALALAKEVEDAVDGSLTEVFDRSGRRQARDRREIGISAVRGGTIVGDHDVIFAGEDEVVTFSHRVYSRRVFANGALTAAAFLAGKPAGLYEMRDALA